ncbi:MAG TPA: ribonuclease R [Candidatus Tripitaka californicus]|uniref:ribonuclease R n=3 Tax=Candidatus Tripitaka californicus TaxID=3367616 RepID=UPI0040281294|nr:ribonuclease R [Planctomycetota bacterium]
MVDAKDLIKFLRGRRYSPMNATALAEHFGTSAEESEGFQKLLRQLEFLGEIVQIKQKQYAIPEKVHLVVGRLRCRPRGYGIVEPVKEGYPEVYIGEEDMGQAMHNDLVVARFPMGVPPRRRGRNRAASGQIVNVLEHVNETVIGAYQRTRRLGFVAPDDSCLFRDIYVAEEDSAGARPGQKVIVKLTQWPSRHLAPEGMIVEVLGEDGDPWVDTVSVVYQYRLPNKFSPEVEEETRAAPQEVKEEDLRGRLDLRDKLTITIDPEDAKDFDDAVSLERLGRGHLKLGVHIADVSHYVRPGSATDLEGSKRGTSVYFPGEVIPMLPEPLSAGICSLKAGVDRLTKTVFLSFTPQGTLVSSEIRHSVIRVTKRLTYKEASKILTKDKAASSEVPEEVRDLLSQMAELAQKLWTRRVEDGALELDLPEVSLRLDETGRVAEVEKVERDVSHKLIEEFMLAANGAVARFMHEKDIPYFSRIHPKPEEEEMRNFAEFIKELEQVKLDPFKRRHIQDLLKRVAGRPEAYQVNLALLRSLKKAQYSDKWGPHFALAMDYYTHFTSPIRRYPDLFVHRTLDHYLLERRKPGEIRESYEFTSGGLADLAEHCSFTERRADEAEREITKLKLLRHLEGRVGEAMEGVITGVEEFGLFVQLKDLLLDGLVHVRNLVDDFYKLDRKRMAMVGNRRGRVFRVGQELKVKIDHIDFFKREADFILA